MTKCCGQACPLLERGGVAVRSTDGVVRITSEENRKEVSTTPPAPVGRRHPSSFEEGTRPLVNFCILREFTLAQAALPQTWGAIAGRYLSADGKPVPGVQGAAMASPLAGEPSLPVEVLETITRTDVDGFYRLDRVP